MTSNYRANGKRAVWDWTPEMDRDLMDVRVQAWHERKWGSPSCFLKVARKYGKSIAACSCRYYKLRKGNTHEGLWTPEEDDLILAEIPLRQGRVADGTWIELSEILTHRTVSAIRTRASNLRRGKRGGGT